MSWARFVADSRNVRERGVHAFDARDNARMERWTFPGLPGRPIRLDAPGARVDSDTCGRFGAGGVVKVATIVPVHKGGRRVRSNMRGLCAECLRIKRAEDR
ncbi:MAG: hypothetical protein ACKOV8_13075 [Phycisphaerales bacterium]